MLMYFKSGSAKMTIDPDKFFPLPMDKLRKFVKVLSQADFPECDENVEQVKRYLKNRLRTLSEKRSFYNNHYIKDKDCDNEIDEYFIEQQRVALRKTVDHIAKLQEKVRKNLEYVENR